MRLTRADLNNPASVRFARDARDLKNIRDTRNSRTRCRWESKAAEPFDENVGDRLMEPYLLRESTPKTPALQPKKKNIFNLICSIAVRRLFES
jgi:hypothetical protein